MSEEHEGFVVTSSGTVNALQSDFTEIVNHQHEEELYKEAHEERLQAVGQQGYQDWQEHRGNQRHQIEQKGQGHVEHVESLGEEFDFKGQEEELRNLYDSEGKPDTGGFGLESEEQESVELSILSRDSLKESDDNLISEDSNSSPLALSAMGFLIVNLALLTSQLLFGGWHVFGKWAMSGDNKANPIVFALIREGIAGPLLLILAVLIDKTNVIPKRPDWIVFLCLGATGVWGNQLFFILGLNATSATYAAIMQPSIPVFSVAIALAIKRETFSIWKCAGVLSAAVGAVVMVGFSSNSQEENINNWGIVFLVINCISMAIYIIIQKPVLSRYSPLTVTAWAYLIGSIMMGFTSLLYVKDPNAWVIKPNVWIALCYSIFLSTMLSYFLIAWAHKRTSSTLVAAYNTVQPASAAFFSYIFLNEVLSWNQGVGALFVLTGLGLVTWQKYKEDKMPLPR